MLDELYNKLFAITESIKPINEQDDEDEDDLEKEEEEFEEEKEDEIGEEDEDPDAEPEEEMTVDDEESAEEDFDAAEGSEGFDEPEPELGGGVPSAEETEPEPEAEPEAESEEAQIEKQYLGKKDDDTYYYLNKIEGGWNVTDAEGKIVFPLKGQAPEVPENDVVGFIIQAQRDLELEEISGDIFTRYFQPALEEEEEVRDEEAGIEYEGEEEGGEEEIDLKDEAPLADEFGMEEEKPMTIESKYVVHYRNIDSGEKGTFRPVAANSEKEAYKEAEARLIRDIGKEDAKYFEMMKAERVNESWRDDEEEDIPVVSHAELKQKLRQQEAEKMFGKDWEELDTDEQKAVDDTIWIRKPRKRTFTRADVYTESKSFSSPSSGTGSDSSGPALNESVSELIHEVPEIDEVDQMVLEWAIEKDIISDVFPDILKMVNELDEVLDDDADGEEVDALIDAMHEGGNYFESVMLLQIYYLKKILLPKAHDAYAGRKKVKEAKSLRCKECNHVISKQTYDKYKGLCGGCFDISEKEEKEDMEKCKKCGQEIKNQRGKDGYCDSCGKDEGVDESKARYDKKKGWSKTPTAKQAFPGAVDIEKELKKGKTGKDIKKKMTKNESKMNEIKFIFDRHSFNVELTEDNENGITINVNDKQKFNFTSHFANLYRDEKGQISEDSLVELAKSALSNLSEEYFEELAKGAVEQGVEDEENIKGPEEPEPNIEDEPVKESKDMKKKNESIVPDDSDSDEKKIEKLTEEKDKTVYYYRVRNYERFGNRVIKGKLRASYLQALAKKGIDVYDWSEEDLNKMSESLIDKLAEIGYWFDKEEKKLQKALKRLQAGKSYVDVVEEYDVAIGTSPEQAAKAFSSLKEDYVDESKTDKQDAMDAIKGQEEEGVEGNGLRGSNFEDPNEEVEDFKIREEKELYKGERAFWRGVAEEETEKELERTIEKTKSDCLVAIKKAIQQNPKAKPSVIISNASKFFPKERRTGALEYVLLDAYRKLKNEEVDESKTDKQDAVFDMMNKHFSK